MHVRICLCIDACCPIARLVTHKHLDPTFLGHVEYAKHVFDPFQDYCTRFNTCWCSTPDTLLMQYFRQLHSGVQDMLWCGSLQISLLTIPAVSRHSLKAMHHSRKLQLMPAIFETWFASKMSQTAHPGIISSNKEWSFALTTMLCKNPGNTNF